MKHILSIAQSLLMIVAFHLVIGWVVTVTWNWSMPDLFQLPQATWQNGVGLAFLASSLQKRTTIATSCR